MERGTGIVARDPKWLFTKQGDKFGYFNNPNWIDLGYQYPTEDHTPCGYWWARPASDNPPEGDIWHCCPQAVCFSGSKIWFVTTMDTTPDEIRVYEHNIVYNTTTEIYRESGIIPNSFAEPFIGFANRGDTVVLVLAQLWSQELFVRVFKGGILYSSKNMDGSLANLGKPQATGHQNAIIDNNGIIHILMAGSTGPTVYDICSHDDGKSWAFNTVETGNSQINSIYSLGLTEGSDGVLYAWFTWSAGYKIWKYTGTWGTYESNASTNYYLMDFIMYYDINTSSDVKCYLQVNNSTGVVTAIVGAESNTIYTTGAAGGLWPDLRFLPNEFDLIVALGAAPAASRPDLAYMTDILFFRRTVIGGIGSWKQSSTIYFASPARVLTVITAALDATRSGIALTCYYGGFLNYDKNGNPFRQLAFWFSADIALSWQTVPIGLLDITSWVPAPKELIPPAGVPIVWPFTEQPNKT